MRREEGVVEGAKLGCHVTIEEGRVVLGELSIKGINTSLYLHDSKFFHIKDSHSVNLNGVLHDRTKITVLDCHVLSSLGSAYNYGEDYSFAEVRPAYIVSGNRHLSADAPSVRKIVFHVDDAEDIFYDFDAMGHVIEPKPLINLVVEANEQHIDRKITTGPNPEIIFFAGRTELANVETEFGRVRIYHRPFPSNPLSSPRYAGIRNHTLVEMEFGEPLFLAEALSRVLSLLRFLELLAGRPQNIDSLLLGTLGDDVSWLELYWTHLPRRSTAWEERGPHPTEILESVVDNSGDFCALLARWISADSDRLEARVRFSNGFSQQRSFSIDRLVGAANMFDILPDDAYPPIEPITEAVAEARRAARANFRALPESPERTSILNALGRLGSPTLRSKVRHRAEMVSRALKKPLPDLDIVTDEAVKCRNYYVHGSPGTFSYAEHGGITTFLTSALEFFFAASDLLDSGWNIQRWYAGGTVGAHPFNRLLLDWDRRAAQVRVLREGGGASPDE